MSKTNIKANPLITKNRNGEFIYNSHKSDISKKYKPDTPMDNAIVPYLVMIFCAVVDCVVFLSLFKLLSYDNKLMLAVQVAGMLFAFDAVPVYLGIQLRRVKQKLTSDRWILYLAVGVFILAFIVNMLLNVMTIDIMNPDNSSSTSFVGATVEVPVEKEIDPAIIALTIFRIVCPLLTSCGSFFISYLTYNPLQIRKRKYEEMIADKKDEIRRFEANLDEYIKAGEDFIKDLFEDDEGNYEEMQIMQRAKVVNYCEYVKQRLKEHIGTPTAVSALSEEDCTRILMRLDTELAAFKKPDILKASEADIDETDIPSVDIDETDFPSVDIAV